MNEIFKYTWEVFSKNIYYIIKLSLLYFLIGVLANTLIKYIDISINSRFILLTAIQISVFASYICALALFLSQQYLNNLESIKTNILKSIFYSPLLILTFIIVYSPFIIGFTLVIKSGLSLILFLPIMILGVYMSLKTVFTPFLIILEGFNPIQSIPNSFRRTNNYLSKIFACYILATVFTSLLRQIDKLDAQYQYVNIFISTFSSVISFATCILLQIAMFKIYLTSCIDRNKSEMV